MTPPIQAHGLWKRFRRGERHDSLRDFIPALLRRRQRSEDSLDKGEFWAVRDVSFTVERGQALGIIGPNGAGKSTMLKLLNRILRPTRGSITLRGRTAALIELAAGFHPDLTGRENVFLQGAIMGMRKDELERRLDDIIDFSGIGPFIDTPVKRYSSGMNARLGFSIAAHLDPEVLLIDEVLSVGDMAFQQRCIQRMHEFKRNGTAIVFISHDLQAVTNLCDSALYLKSTALAYGPVGDVMTKYVSASVTSKEEAHSDVVIERAQLTDAAGNSCTVCSPGTELRLVVDYSVVRPRPGFVLGLLLIRSTDGFMVYDSNFVPEEVGMDAAREGRQRVVYHVRANVTRGLYHFGLHVYDGSANQFLSRLEPAASISVQETRTYAGVADLGAYGLAEAREDGLDN